MSLTYAHRKSRLFIAFFALLSAVSPALASDIPQLIVNSSHVGQVDFLIYSPEHDTLVSGGSDGSVRVWDASTRELLRSLQVSHLPIEGLSMHPQRNEIAVTTRTPSGFRLAAWTLDSGNELFARELNSRPLSMNYSPQGTWLVYTRTGVPSVVTLDSESGEQDERVGSGTGIVGFFTIGASEANIMTYAPSNGRIVYTSLSDGRTLQTATALPSLTMMRILQNRRYAAARSGQDLVVVDIVNGTEIARVEVPHARGITVDSGTGRILVLHGTQGNRGLSTFSFTGSTLRPVATHRNPATADITAAVSVDNSLLTGGPAGQIARYRNERLETFGENVLLPIRSVGFAPNRMLVTADGFGTTVYSDFFSAGRVIRSTERLDALLEGVRLDAIDDTERPPFDVTEPNGTERRVPGLYGRRGDDVVARPVSIEESAPELSLMRTSRYEAPAPPRKISDLGEAQLIEVNELIDEPWGQAPATSGRLTPLLDGEFLLWGSSEAPLVRLAANGAREPIAPGPATTSESRVRQVVATDSNITILYDNGTVEQRHPVTLNLRQTRTVSSAQTAVYARDDLLVVGRNSPGAGQSALIRVDPQTGETVQLSSRAFYVFRVAADPRRGALYALGLERFEGSTVTTLERLTGENLQNSEVLLRVRAEDLESDVAIDQVTGAVYVAAGFEGISVWDGGEVRRLQRTTHLPRRLFISRQKVISVNGNGTLSIWDQVSEQHLTDLYLFEDNRWVAIGSDGGYFTADGMRVEDRLRFTDSNVSRDVSDARIVLPLTAPRYDGERRIELESVIRTLGPRQ